MKTSITQTFIQKLKPGTDAWVYDTQLPGFVLRVRPSGKHSYLALLGRGKWFTLGRADVLKPEEARTLAKDKIGDVAKGKDPIEERRNQREQDEQARAEALTFDAFLTTHYEPWVLVNRKCGAQTVSRLRAIFSPTFGATPLHAFDPFAVERWRAARLKQGRKPATVNRDLGDLKTVLARAVEWASVTRLTHHPLRMVKPAKVDKIGKNRYLSPAELTRLHAALEARDAERRAARERANAWRRERGYPERPVQTYADHLTPITLLALHTGLRFGELTALTWADVNPNGTAQTLRVRAETAKSDKTRYVPLNADAAKILAQWKPAKVSAGDYVFPGRTKDERLIDIKTAWAKLLKAAKIKAFRFHDTRHCFASYLAQRSVDLNVIRELLGHADLKMVLRYAHLGDEHKRAAVSKLVASGA